jgi:hypothetical protein
MADKAIQKGYTKRYLPESAWASLSKEEREETDQKKRTGSRQGKQFIPNTDKCKESWYEPPVVTRKVSNFIINRDT